MAAARRAGRAELEDRLGHRFTDPDLLDTALTHVSAGAEGASYQRLEFLGDRVLGLVVATTLIETYTEASEGELSQRLAHLVRRESCASMAASWDIGAHLKLGGGESRAGGRRNETILADVAEAVIGAVYLDGGLEAASVLVQRALSHSLRSDLATLRDAKTALQEWAQGSGLAPPVYALIARTGPDHAPRFDVAATVSGLEQAVGRGRSKRSAEQEAAAAMLRREGIWPGNGGHAAGIAAHG